MPKRKDGEKHRGREAQAMSKIGRPRIIESPAEMERLSEEYITVSGHGETPVRKGETPVGEGI